MKRLALLFAASVAATLGITLAQTPDTSNVEKLSNCPVFDFDKKVNGPKVLDTYFDYLRQTGRRHIVNETNGIMGIHLLTEYVNKSGELCWRMEYCIDDRFEDVLPKGYFFYYHLITDLFIVFRGDENGKKVPYNSLKTDYDKACFNDIVGDRVYTRPRKRPRMMYDKVDKKWISDRTQVTGSFNSELTAIFQSTGTIKYVAGN